VQSAQELKAQEASLSTYLSPPPPPSKQTARMIILKPNIAKLVVCKLQKTDVMLHIKSISMKSTVVLKYVQSS
jgi:hypothetical protein